MGAESMWDQILSAAERLNGHANPTPHLRSSTLNQLVGADVVLKGENFQKVGAFKFRGAYNAIATLSERDRNRGVIAYSSGNHAQAVAKVGQSFGIKTVIVMPTNAPAIKQQATRGYGAEVVLYDPLTSQREAVTMALQERHGYTLIPPFDHPQVIAGQGTSALELMQAEAVDMLLVPCGGGGLLTGCAIAAKHLNPNCTVIGIEPEVADDATQSFYTGVLHRQPNPPTIADGTRTPALGELTFPLILDYVDAMKTVSEQAIMDAVAFLFYRMKIVVEPSGALGVAALLSGAVTAEGDTSSGVAFRRRIGVILSGGNMDGETLQQILQSAHLPT